MNEGSFYENKQSPEVGDIVTVSRKNTLSYYSPISKDYVRKFRVDEVIQGVKSKLVKITPIGNAPNWILNPMKTSQFKLVERAKQMTDSSNDTRQKYIVMDNSFNHLLTGSDKVDLMRKISNILMKDHTKVLHIFSYEQSVRTEAPKLQVFNMDTKESVTNMSHATIKNSSGLFTKT